MKILAATLLLLGLTQANNRGNSNGLGKGLKSTGEITRQQIFGKDSLMESCGVFTSRSRRAEQQKKNIADSGAQLTTQSQGGATRTQEGSTLQSTQVNQTKSQSTQSSGSMSSSSSSTQKTLTSQTSQPISGKTVTKTTTVTVLPQSNIDNNQVSSTQRSSSNGATSSIVTEEIEDINQGGNMVIETIGFGGDLIDRQIVEDPQLTKTKTIKRKVQNVSKQQTTGSSNSTQEAFQSRNQEKKSKAQNTNINTLASNTQNIVGQNSGRRITTTLVTKPNVVTTYTREFVEDLPNHGLIGAAVGVGVGGTASSGVAKTFSTNQIRTSNKYSQASSQFSSQFSRSSSQDSLLKTNNQISGITSIPNGSVSISMPSLVATVATIGVNKENVDVGNVPKKTCRQTCKCRHRNQSQTTEGCKCKKGIPPTSSGLGGSFGNRLTMPTIKQPTVTAVTSQGVMKTTIIPTQSVSLIQETSEASSSSTNSETKSSSSWSSTQKVWGGSVQGASSNTIRGDLNMIQGNYNLLSGGQNELYGHKNIVQGNVNQIMGVSNALVGQSNLVVGSDNALLGTGNGLVGSANGVVGNDNNVVGEGNKIRAKGCN